MDASNAAIALARELAASDAGIALAREVPAASLVATPMTDTPPAKRTRKDQDDDDQPERPGRHTSFFPGEVPDGIRILLISGVRGSGAHATATSIRTFVEQH